MNFFTEERCKELMDKFGKPNSNSLYVLLHQVANEVEQAVRSDITSKTELNFLANVINNHSERLDMLERGNMILD